MIPRKNNITILCSKYREKDHNFNNYNLNKWWDEENQSKYNSYFQYIIIPTISLFNLFTLYLLLVKRSSGIPTPSEGYFEVNEIGINSTMTKGYARVVNGGVSTQGSIGIANGSVLA